MQNQNSAVVRALAIQAKFKASAPQTIAPVVVPSIRIGRMSVAQLEARATELRRQIVSYEAQFKDPSFNAELDLSEQYEALIDEADAELSAIDAQLGALEERAEAAPKDELLGDDFLLVAPDLVPTIVALRGHLSKMISGSASTHDLPAIEDAIARSGFLIRRAAGEDVTAAVAAYEASLLEAPDEDDSDDDDFARYGACDDYPDLDPYR